MASLNKVILIGHLVADPELKQTQTGVSVCSFSIGVTRRFKNAEGKYESDFINIVTWRQTAEFVTKFFKKGKPICVVGSLQTRNWVDKDGNKRYTTEVVADEASFVEKSDNNPQYNGGLNTGSGNSQNAPDSYNPPSYSSNDGQASKFEDLSGDDDLPF
jgi:single-strand DNA-binding protein